MKATFTCATLNWTVLYFHWPHFKLIRRCTALLTPFRPSLLRYGSARNSAWIVRVFAFIVTQSGPAAVLLCANPSHTTRAGRVPASRIAPSPRRQFCPLLMHRESAEGRRCEDAAPLVGCALSLVAYFRTILYVQQFSCQIDNPITAEGMNALKSFFDDGRLASLSELQVLCRRGESF